MENFTLLLTRFSNIYGLNAKIMPYTDIKNSGTILIDRSLSNSDHAMTNVKYPIHIEKKKQKNVLHGPINQLTVKKF